MHIRSERREDAPRIHDLHRAAFGSTLEGDIVDALRAAGVSLVSLVAVNDGEIVGHIQFSPVTLTDADDLQLVALGPLAALPDRQRRGIGSALVNSGIEECRRRGVQAVFVVGHAAYYPRFGFVQAVRFGISCEFNVADDVFMVLELVEGSLRGRAGVVRFHAAFQMS
jgi:putative acetyltransferase